MFSKKLSRKAQKTTVLNGNGSCRIEGRKKIHHSDTQKLTPTQKIQDHWGSCGVIPLNLHGAIEHHIEIVDRKILLKQQSPVLGMNDLEVRSNFLKLLVVKGLEQTQASQFMTHIRHSDLNVRIAGDGGINYDQDQFPDHFFTSVMLMMICIMWVGF